jgi:hypothetical protein
VILAITRADGELEERLAYDPWGKRRGYTAVTTDSLVDNKGDTSHEIKAAKTRSPGKSAATRPADLTRHCVELPVHSTALRVLDTIPRFAGPSRSNGIGVILRPFLAAKP